MIRSVLVPKSVVLALQLDDQSVLHAFEARPEATRIHFLPARDGQMMASGRATALRDLASELQYVASSEYDMPFSIRGACGRVALRILRQMDGAV